MHKAAEFILRHPKKILALFGILALASLYPAVSIETDFDLENFFPRQDPTIEDYQYLEREFGRDDNIITVGFKTDSLLSSEVLGDLKEITDSIKSIRYVTEVRSLWSAENIKSEGNRLIFDPYLSEDTLAEIDPDSLAEDLQNDSFIKGFFINSRSNATAFYIEIREDKNNFDTREQIIDRIEEVLDVYSAKYDFKISGIPYYRNQYVHFLNDEILFYITLSTLLIVLLLWILYRSWQGIFYPMVIVWFTILMTLAVMHLTGGYFEVMSSTIAPILLSVGIADSIHMISKYDDARLQGLSKRGSILEMLYTLGYATFLTSITTAIGFGSLAASNIVPMKRFGIYTASGVMIAFIITILFLPSALSLIRSKQIFKEKSSFFFDSFSGFLKITSDFNRNHYKKIAVGFLFLTIAVGSGISMLKVNGRVFDELGTDTKPIRDARFFSDNLAPPFPMEFIIDTGTENGVMEPTFLKKVDRLVSHLNSYEEVNRVVSVNTLLKEVHKAMAPKQFEEHPIPDDEQLIAQYLLLLEFNESDILQRVANFDYRRVRVSANVYDVGSYRINRIRDSLQVYLAQNFPDQKITITGSTVLSADLNNKIVTSLFKSILIAFVLISILMAIMFRNAQMVFISLVPNILPLLMVAGIMGFAGIDIKASTAVIFTIAFGIAVDDSIHYLARIRVEMRRGRSLVEAIPYTTQKTGKAIIVTSLLLLAGFGSLLTSVFISTVYMGLLVSLTIAAALSADLLLLPCLFYWIKPELKVAPPGGKPGSRSADGSHREEALHRSE